MATMTNAQQPALAIVEDRKDRWEKIRDFFSSVGDGLRLYFGPGHPYRPHKEYQGNLSAMEKAVIDAYRWGIPLL